MKLSMENLSASKVVFILVAVSVCVAFLFEVFKGAVVLDAKDFVALVLMAFTFYFTKPADNTPLGGVK